MRPIIPMKLNLMGGGVDISLPNVSYCKDVKDVHYTPYNLVRFYVGEITGTTPQTVKIYTDETTSVDVQVSEGNKWYAYVLPKDKGLCGILYESIKKIVVKADISYIGDMFGDRGILPQSTVEVSFKGSNTSNMTNMAHMFSGCSGLISLDLSNFDTSNVTNMVGMFTNCSGLTELDVSNFDTGNVTSMSYMFYDCSGLTFLDLSNFDTSNVTSMSHMFQGCDGLTSLDISSFGTSNVTYMGSMFNGCSGLTSLNLSNFNTSNVTDMKYMFYGCNGLTSLDLSGWDTSKVTDTNCMFYGCSGLTSLDLSGLVISDVIANMYGMFNGCTSLKTIRMVGCSEGTINKIKAQLTEDNINGVTIVTE